MSDPEVEIRRGEAEASAAEAELGNELARLQAAVGEVSGKLERLRAGVQQAQSAGMGGGQLSELAAQLPGIKLPTLNVAAEREQALAARSEALRARQGAAQRIRKSLQAWSSELSHSANQVAQSTQTLSALEQQMMEQRAAQLRAREVAPAAPRPAPLPSRPLPSDGRKNTRVSLNASIDLHSDTNFFSGFSTDISSGGLFVATHQHAAIGSEIEVAFSLPTGEKVAAKGVVRWTREVNDNTPHISAGIGVQFVDLSPGALDAIQRFVSEREPMFFPD